MVRRELGGTDQGEIGRGRTRRRAPGDISRQLQITAVLVLALIVGVAAQQLWHVRRSMLSDAESQMARLDMVFAEQTGRAAETADLLLRQTIELAQNQRGQPRDPLAMGRTLRRAIEGVRVVSEIMLTDPAGVVLTSSSELASVASPTLAGILARYAAEPTRGLQISEPFRDEDGSWHALMLRAIPAPGDAFDGLVVASLNLSYFEDFYRAVELTENGAIILHRRDGTVLARYPHNDSVIGTSYAELPPFRDILSLQIAGTVRMPSPLDGRMRILAIRALKAFPLAVNVSIDEDLVMAPWRRQAVILIGVALVASGAVATLLLLLAQRSRQVGQLVVEYGAAKESAEHANTQLKDEMVERERAEAALRQAQRIEVVGQLTGGVAHDFNNLLTVVLGNLEMLERTAQLEGRARVFLGTIRTAAERGATLTAQLLAFARRQPLVATPLDFGRMLSGMQQLLLSALGSRIQVVTRVEPGLWPALLDPTQVELIVLNLAINARDAMPAGGTLTITATNVALGPPDRPELPPAGEYVQVTVADTGTGMQPEVLAKAFEPFFTTKGPGKGSGLGLSQVYGVVKQSGGGVRIESTPGIGTEVSVFLPRAIDAPAPAAGGAATPVLARTGDVTVLLVDDDPTVRGTTAQLLGHLGYVVLEAESGAAAIACIEAGAKPHVVLTDVAMPGMTGPALARHLNQHWPHLPVVFFSGYADPQEIAGSDGLKRLVRKPFRPAELAANIESALAERAALAG